MSRVQLWNEEWGWRDYRYIGSYNQTNGVLGVLLTDDDANEYQWSLGILYGPHARIDALIFFELSEHDVDYIIRIWRGPIHTVLQNPKHEPCRIAFTYTVVYHQLCAFSNALMDGDHAIGRKVLMFLF